MKKERVKFVVREIERSSYVPFKKFMLILLEVYCVYEAYRAIEAMRQGGSVAAGMLCSAIALLWTGWLGMYMRRIYRCIPVSDKLDADVLCAGVESAKFVQAGENVWKSDYWIAVGKQFFPRNVVARLEERTFLGKKYTVIWSVTGKKYWMKKQEALQESWFPFIRMLQDYKVEDVWTDKERQKKMTEFFKEYIKEHETSELLKSTGFLRKCIENIKKSAT